MFEVDVMKVILSRKGFDSQYGGYPSPILPDGRMISLPIPSPRDSLCYSDLRVDGYGSYYDVMKQLKSTISYKDGKETIRKHLTTRTRCHLDPDVYRTVRKRPKHWKPIFGQIRAAQTHLENEGVKEGDVFLFFGTFKQIKYEGGRLKFVPEEPEMHIIFGYLQVGEKMRIGLDTKCPRWMNYHPHTDSDRRRGGNNTVYIARDTLTWDSKLPGADTFNYHEGLVLTKEGYSKKSRWDLDAIFKEVKISYHSKKSWKKDGYFQSAAKGQEFVIHSNKGIEKWVKELISTIGS